MLRKPLILAFDTSAAHCAAALLSGDTIVVSRFEPMAKGQAERLMILLEDMMSDAEVHWTDLTAIGVGIGPGNFTGVRISVSAARGLALSLGIPAVGVTGFEALAFGSPRPVATMIDARRDQFYWQEFTDHQVHPPAILNADEITQRRTQDVLALVDGAEHPAVYPFADAIAHVAASRCDTTHVKPAPLYLRAADAAPPRDPAPKDITMISEQLSLIHAHCFTTPRPWSAPEFDELLQNRFTFLVQSEHGFALGRAIAGEAELLTIAVLPRYRNTGIGSFLLTSFETKARLHESQEAFLEVSADNFPAIALYQRANYRQNGARQNYYKTPDGTAKDALLFRKFLF